MNTPDLTRAQLLVLARTIIAALVAFGVGLDTAQQTALLTLVGTLGTGTLLADAIIRHGRARALSPGLKVVNTTPARRTADPAVAGAVVTNQTFTSPPAAVAPIPAAAPAQAAPTLIPGQPIPGVSA